MTIGHGLPLWQPNPNPDPRLPHEIQQKGYGIGDVGIIRDDGSFDFLFNICHSADHPVNFLGVPEGFEKIELLPGTVRIDPVYHQRGADVASTDIHKSGHNIQPRPNEYVRVFYIFYIIFH